MRKSTICYLVLAVTPILLPIILWPFLQLGACNSVGQQVVCQHAPWLSGSASVILSIPLMLSVPLSMILWVSRGMVEILKPVFSRDFTR